MNDVQTGEKVLRAFHSYWRTQPNSGGVSYEKMMELLNQRRPGGSFLLEGIGLGVRSAEISDNRIDAAMRKLAADSGGRLPARNQDFFTYLSNEAVKIDFVDAAIFTAKESAKDIVKGAAAVGDSLIFTGKVVTFILPAVILLFLYIYLKAQARRIS